MDDYTAEAFSNRDEPIPVIGVPGNDALSSDTEGKRDKLKKSLSPSHLKDKIRDAGNSSSSNGSDPGHSLQDRLFAKLLQQVIPAEDINDLSDLQDKRSTKYINRPGFSLPLMTNNFRRFNARIGVVFVFQNRLVRLLSWKVTSHTFSLLAVYTFVCLDPYLLSILPLVFILLFLLVPAFLTRHPPPPSPTTTMPDSQYSIAGPPLAPPRTVKPASEMSKDFFRNMRDLQNCMDDFSTIHDATIKAITPATNFSNEPLSSTLFLFLFTSACILFLTSHLLPWRLIALFLGWTAIALGHPTLQAYVSQTFYKEHVRPATSTARSWLDEWISSDIILDSAPEIREVEIFELQRRKGSFSTQNNDDDDMVEWESWIFSPSAWEPTAPLRIAGERVKGTRFFEDVTAPAGWEFSDKKWGLDLGSKEWVEERMVGGLEVEVEGERWVYDVLNGEGGGTRRRGEWRRRRWVRLVKRKVLRDVGGG
ncbi:hypothetical protein MMC06_005452 [Schaereria dolodes]|nr:hypothetical protein [Schaereria dolodes]